MEHTKMGQQTKNKSMVLQKQEDELKNRVLQIWRGGTIIVWARSSD